MKKRRYGMDVYISSIVSIPVYIIVMVILLKRFHNGSLVIDPMLLTALLTPLIKGISDAINQIRLQFQTNTSHQRINKIKPDKQNPYVIP